MNKQRGIDIVKGAILNEDTQEFVEIVSKLPRDFRLILTGQVMGYAAAKGIDTEPPRPTTPAAAQMAKAL
ncbi:MAG: hypothetical protein FWE91_09695 [Defluviitaleaceae bacterium]|nr:hypothetical protein [Defluviitaleaceae bacterium]